MIINLIKGSIKDCVHDVLCTFQLRRKEIIDFPTKTNKVQRDKLRHKRVICYLIRHLMGLTPNTLNVGQIKSFSPDCKIAILV